MSEAIANILFVCDLPPCNYLGGSVLMSRLLTDYPSDKITVLCTSDKLRTLPKEGRLKCEHIDFPLTNWTGALGLGRIKGFINWLLLLLLAFESVRIIKRKKTQVVLAIAHDYLFLSAAVACSLTSTPLILIVHDDWVSRTRDSVGIVRCFGHKIFRALAKNAAYVYVVSPFMQELMKSQYGVESEVQMPFIEIGKREALPTHEDNICAQNIRIVYTGGGFGSDSIEILIKMIKGNKLREFGIDSCEFHLYTDINSEDVKRANWEDHRVVFHGWVSQSEVRKAIETADILYLPFSFKEEWKYAATACPTKTSDYLAAKKPILVCGPDYSYIVRYAKEFGFAEVVHELNENSLAQGIARILDSKEHRERLLRNASLTFERNHDVARQRSRFYEVANRLARQ